MEVVLLEVDAKTIVCASLANPNRGSKSPKMHNAGFEAIGINFVYVAFEPEKKYLKDAIMGIRGLGIKGVSVSKPYKEEVIQYLDEIDPIAQAIGAVNTILNHKNKLIGYNSDWIGAVRAVEQETPIKNKKIVIVGAGGAAKAIAYGLKKAGGIVLIYNRSQEKAKQLVEDFGLELSGNLEDLSKVEDYDILVNATSVGSNPNTDYSIIPEHILLEDKIVLDVVIDPIDTLLIKRARERRCHVVNGLKMLIFQGAFQFKLFTGSDAPLGAMEKIFS
jgi:shikimate dehydrogenase